MKTSVALLSVLLSVGAASAVSLKDVSFTCSPGNCNIRFLFDSDKNLPAFFQKYDSFSHKLTVGFSETDFPLGEGSFVLDSSSNALRSVRVFHDASKKVKLLNFEFTVGSAVTGDKNPAGLSSGRNFVVTLPAAKSKAWALSKVAIAQRKAEKAAATAQAAADKKAAAEMALADKKAAAAQTAADREAAAAQAAADKKAAAEKTLADKKAAAAQTAADRKAAAAQAAADKKAAAEMALADKKAAAGQTAADKKTAATEKQVPAKKAPSILIDGVREMSDLAGNGMEQFRIVTDSAIVLSKVTPPDKASLMIVSIAGPLKSPVFKVNAGNIVKSVAWGQTGLRIQLFPGVCPVILTSENSLILQIPVTATAPGFESWVARPDGIQLHDWKKGAEESAPDFDAFVNGYQKNGKKIVSTAQSFKLHPAPQELIVVAEEADLLASPNENATVVQRMYFGERLANVSLNGLFYKVRIEGKVGFVNRRSVSFRDELSAVQSERLKQMDLDKMPGSDSSGLQFEDLTEDRVSYSSFGRRDPFVEIKGLVQEGINVDQVELVGIIWESDTPMAILADTKNPSVSYTVKEGDKILNGKVLKITQTDVLFLLQEFGVSRRYSMSLPDKYGGNK